MIGNRQCNIRASLEEEDWKSNGVSTQEFDQGYLLYVRRTHKI